MRWFTIYVSIFTFGNWWITSSFSRFTFLRLLRLILFFIILLVVLFLLFLILLSNFRHHQLLSNSIYCLLAIHSILFYILFALSFIFILILFPNTRFGLISFTWFIVFRIRRTGKSWVWFIFGYFDLFNNRWYLRIFSWLLLHDFILTALLKISNFGAIFNIDLNYILKF